MNRNWIKTFGVIVLALVLFAQATSIAGSKDAEKTKKTDSTVLTDTPAGAEQVFKPRPSRAYLQRPRNHSSKQPRWDQKPAHYKDKYPRLSNSQLLKAKQSSKKERKLSSPLDRAKNLHFANRKSKKAAGRVRSKLPKSTAPVISQEQSEQMYQKFLLRMTQGRSNASQAETIRKLMLKRRKLPPKQPTTTD